MKNRHLMIKHAVAIALYGSLISMATAQEATSDNSDTVMEEIVVTGVVRPVNRLESSVSTSSIDVDSVLELAPRSTEEIFRSMPGIRAESSGGEGNANITIRGIPLATGGSKYLQLQEDGLPVLEYGDMNFANADNFVKYDWSVARIESIRGGSASTFASDSPGGIINFISNHGDKEGGAVGASFGLDYREMRSDFAYGGKLSDDLNFHIGGYLRNGEGVRHTGFNGNKGGQIKFNITKQLDGGYLRLYAKRLDDRTSTYMPAPVLVKSNGKFGAAPGFDASHDSLYSPYQTQVNTFDAYGNPVSRDLTDGIHAKSNAFGFEFDKDVGDGWHINNKFRTSSVTGGFIAPFTDTFGIGIVPAQQWGNQLCANSSTASGSAATGCTNTTVRYAAGPNAGQVYTGLAWTNLQFDTTFNDVGLQVNDLKLSKEFGAVTATVGYYNANQKIAIDWNAWQFQLETVSRDPVPLEVTSSTGQVIAQNGLYWPALLSWSWNLNYDTTAPYFNLGGSIDKFNWDASARFDHVRARGTLFQACCGNSGGFDYDGDGSISVAEARGAAFVKGNTPSGRVNYNASHTEYSLGGSYLISSNSSVFARYSSGARFDADRLLQVSGALNSDGSLTDATKGYDEVKQMEVGYKLELDGLKLYATAFDTITDETNADITTGQTFMRTYKSQGLELESDWRMDNGLGVNGNLTWTHARIDKDKITPALEGNKPRRQADFIWTVTPAWRADNWSAGVAVQGSSAYYLADTNQLKQNAYMLFNLFGTYKLTDALSASLTVNNALDAFVLTESEEGSGAAGTYVRGRPLTGRTSGLALRYSF